MKWLRDLLARIEAFPDKDINSQEPDAELSDNEKVIGIVPVGLRKLFAYHGALIDKANSLIKAHIKEHEKPGHTREMCEKFAGSVTLLKEEIEVTRVVLWRELRDELKTTAHELGVRKGWKVVEVPKKEEEPRIEVINVSVGSLGEFLRRR